MVATPVPYGVTPHGGGAVSAHTVADNGETMTVCAMNHSAPMQVLSLASPQLAGHVELRTMHENAAAGYGFLRTYLGEATTRQALFRDSLHVDRVLVAMVCGQFAGVLGYRLRGVGPMSPRWHDFIRIYGGTAWKAWAAFRFAELLMRSPGAYVCWLHVFPEFRRQGVGRALIHELSAIALRHGKHSVELHVRRSNTVATVFYQKLGFTQIKSEFDFLGCFIPGYDFVRLALKIGDIS